MRTEGDCGEPFPGRAEDTFREETVESREVFSGQLLRLRRETVRFPDGRTAQREIVAHAPAVAILPVDDRGRVTLVRQYRKPLETTLWELPAGKIEAGEEPEECARRELAEEAGLMADRLEYVGRIATTPGFSDEVIHLFRALGLRRVTGVASDPDEDLECAAFPWDVLWGMVERGEVWDAKSLCLILREAVRNR